MIANHNNDRVIEGTTAGSGGGGTQLDIDWVGSTDQERGSAQDIAGHRIVASITYDATTPTSFLNGCAESQDSQPSGASPAGIVVGARSDPGMAYGRFFNGVINEMMVFSRALTTDERTRVENVLSRRWPVALKNVSACQRVACNVIVGPTPAVIAHLKAFVAATAAEPLASTLVRTMASTALQYVASAADRCSGLNNGTIPQLRSASANKASITQLVTTAASVATGVENYAANTLARLAPGDPVAAALLKLWNSTALSGNTMQK